MKRMIYRMQSLLISAIMIFTAIPVVVPAEEIITADYSVSPDYADRYPYGVIEFLEPDVTVHEGEDVTLKLIRKGGTEGTVSVEVKAIDITAKFGVDYNAATEGALFVQDGEYQGTLTELYLSEIGEDCLTTDEILNDEVYKSIIGYNEEEQMLSDEETQQLYDASVGIVSDTLSISEEEAKALLEKAEQESSQNENEEGSDPIGSLTDENALEADFEETSAYRSSLHELKDSVLGEATMPNGMDQADLIDYDALLGSNDNNLAASAVNDAAIGASQIVTFEEGENEKIIYISAIDDGDYEPQEVVTFGLCNPEGGAELGEAFNAAVRIDDNDGTELSEIGFSEAAVSVSSGETAGVVEIVRKGCLNDYAAVNVRTEQGTAVEWEDYLPVEVSAVFLPGEEKKMVLVPLKTSIIDQSEEKTFDLVLEIEAGSAELVLNRATFRILPEQASVPEDVLWDENEFEPAFANDAGYAGLPFGFSSFLLSVPPTSAPLPTGLIAYPTDPASVKLPAPTSFFLQKIDLDIIVDSHIYDDTDHVFETERVKIGRLTQEHITYSIDDELQSGELVLTDQAAKAGYRVAAYTFQQKIFGKGSIQKKVGTTFSAVDFINLVGENMPGLVEPIPVIESDSVDYITLADFPTDQGIVKLGKTEYEGGKGDRTITSTQWHEGDQLKIYCESLFGYKWKGMEVIRADGTVESYENGEPLFLTKGMTVRPLFKEEDITITVNWRKPTFGAAEDKITNLKDYKLASDHEFVDNGDGTYTFSNMIPDDVVTIYAVAKDQDAKKTHTGYWTRVTKEGETRMNDDVRFLSCIGDAYAFQVDDHDMAINYYFMNYDSSKKGSLVRGRVVTNGGTIKNPSTVTVNAGNVDEVGVPVAGAGVYVLSSDPNASLEEDGVCYYTNAATDKDGYFTVYLPGYEIGLGYCIAISENNRIYQNTTIYQENGVTIYQLPYQNPDFQINRMTVGSDTNTCEIAIGDTDIKLGVNVVVSAGYRALYLKFRSYDEKGALFKEWIAKDSSSEYWTFESQFKPQDYLKEGGRLTVEVYDINGRGQGEFDTGYLLRTKPKASTFTLPQFDPLESVTLPVLGDVSSVFDMGSDDHTLPEDEQLDDTELAGSKPVSDKHYLEINYGAGKAIKAAVKAARKEDNYKELDANGRASLVLYKLNTDSKDHSSILSKKSTVRGGKGKNALDFDYELGVYMSLYTQSGKFFFEELTLYASIGASASTNQQFVIAGIPVYLGLGGSANGKLLLQMDPENGKELEITDPQSNGYVNSMLFDKLKTGGTFVLSISVKITLGVGVQKFLSAEVSGTLGMDIEYQPWKEGAGIANFSLDAGIQIIGMTVKFNIVKTSYGMFKSSGYTGSMDFSKVENADKFKKSSHNLMFSYKDSDSLTEVYGGVERRSRGSSLNNAVPGEETLLPNGQNSQYEPVMAELLREDVLDTMNPHLLPLENGEDTLYLRLDNDSTRGDNDFSSVVYSTIDRNGFESSPVYLDPDDSFDSNLTAQVLSDGRILAVWSDLDRSLGSGNIDPGESLNHTNLSYCIFDADGNPGEVKQLTNGKGCDALPVIAHDAVTGKTLIAYTSTDYQTEGVSFNEENVEELGSFLYNSYSTVCFKVIDQNGEIQTDYTAAENTYLNYEAEHGKGILNGMRYLNTQLDPKVTQATVDELTGAAKDGKAYLFFSLDSDRSTSTNEDRDLYMVQCDLTSMEQSEPLRMTADANADVNPQAVVYDGRLLLFWNNAGEISCMNPLYVLGKAAEGETEQDYTAFFTDLSNAASAYQVGVQADGSLSLTWIGWDEEGETPRRAVFFREYDPDFRISTGDESEPYVYGSWGKSQIITSANEDQDLNEAAILKNGNKMLLHCKILNLNGDGVIDSRDSFLVLLDRSNKIGLYAEFYPETPMPGETASVLVKAINTGSLPSEKLTVQAFLVGENGYETEIGTQVFEEHYQSEASAPAYFNGIVIPENVSGSKIRVEAWEDDMWEKAVSEEFALPFAPDVSIEDIDLNRMDDGSYLVSMDLDNSGNKEFDGVLCLTYVNANWTDPENETEMVAVADDTPVLVGAKEETHQILFFTVPEEQFDEGGVCKIMVTAEDADGNTYDNQTIYLHRPVNRDTLPSDVYIDGSPDADPLVLNIGDTKQLETSVMPYDARGNCHIAYSVKNADVASVDPQGKVTAKKAGSTKVTVSVYKNEISTFVGSNSRATDGSGTPLVIDENGLVSGISKAAERSAVLTKTIDVTVKGTSDNTKKTALTKKGVSLKKTTYVYTGKTITPAVTVKSGSKVLKKGTDYTVKYSKNRYVGTATVTVKGKGAYKGTVQKTFRIIPKTARISKVKTLKKGFGIYWEKQPKQVTGYQIQYSQDKNFRSGVKTVTVKGAYRIYRKITGLKAGKRYYVRIRRYKTVGDKKYYSAWSAKKSVKTK